MLPLNLISFAKTFVWLHVLLLQSNVKKCIIYVSIIIVIRIIPMFSVHIAQVVRLTLIRLFFCRWS